MHAVFFLKKLNNLFSFVLLQIDGNAENQKLQISTKKKNCSSFFSHGNLLT